MENNIINKHQLNIRIYKEKEQYRLGVMNGSYDENYYSDICFNNITDLIKGLQKEIDFYKELNS